MTFKLYTNIPPQTRGGKEEAKDGPVGTDGSEGHTVAARGREALLCSYTNFCSLRQTEMSWPLIRQNSQRVPLED